MKELETVVLLRDIPEYGLYRNDIGAIVHCYEDGTTFEIEFVTGEGRTIAVVTLNAHDVRTMHANEILHVRAIQAA